MIKRFVRDLTLLKSVRRIDNRGGRLLFSYNAGLNISLVVLT